jgi:hypothetical protein
MEQAFKNLQFCCFCNLKYRNSNCRDFCVFLYNGNYAILRKSTRPGGDSMFTPHIRSADILGNSKLDIETILRGKDQVLLSENGKNTAVIIGMQEYEALKDAMYDRYVLQKLGEAEAIENDPTAWGTEDDLMRVLNT